MERQIIVLKFGSSVLTSVEDLPKTVTEIMRWRRQGYAVLAVVSAIGDDTDRLAAIAASFGTVPTSVHRARLLSQGESRSAALLALACEQVGLEPQVLDATALSWLAGGPRDDAMPVSLDRDHLCSYLEKYDVVIVPGFAAVDLAGNPVLLGRGGCDLAAVFLGHWINAADVRLIKDVDGVYEYDPAKVGIGSVARYIEVSWQDARDASDGLIQDKALRYAAVKNRPLTVAALGREGSSRIGTRTRQPTLVRRRRPLRVALAGCGVVGGGVLQRLRQEPDRFHVTGILVRDRHKARVIDVSSANLTEDPDALFAQNPDVLIEATNGTETALHLYRRAVEHGVSIVTANKQAVAQALLTQLVPSGKQFRYAATVGGGAPMIETVRAACRLGLIDCIEGVLTGTANFVLDALVSGQSLDEAIEAAQRAGLAEADPSLDLDGHDAAAKLRILSHEAFGHSPSRCAVLADAISTATMAAAGQTLRQIARIEHRKGKLHASVRLAPADDELFAKLRGPRCALRVTLTDGRVLIARGLGAGRWPTTESILADLGDIARDFERAGRSHLTQLEATA